MLRRRDLQAFIQFLVLLIFTTGHSSLVTVWAGQRPSLFRGVVVADSPQGIRVISVEENSQAYLADLRPEDIIMQVNGSSLKTIDDFAVLSHQLKGQATKAEVIVLRSGEPHTLLVHLYSVPILRHWGLTFVPEHDIRFAEPKTGVAYWTRLGKGFEVANNLEQALNAYLNALHNDPAQLDVALKVSELLWTVGQQALTDHRLREALIAMQEGAVLLEHLTEQPLTEAQLQSVKQQLEGTTNTLKGLRQKSP